MTLVQAALAASAPAMAPAPQPVSVTSQNLFEHMAGSLPSLPHGASPADLGRTLVDNLKGFVERAGQFSVPANTAGEPSAPLPGGKSFTAALPANEHSPPVPDKQVARVVDSLGKIFDHSIETQMVVRGTTQVSGAVNTLVKGQ